MNLRCLVHVLSFADTHPTCIALLTALASLKKLSKAPVVLKVTEGHASQKTSCRHGRNRQKKLNSH